MKIVVNGRPFEIFQSYDDYNTILERYAQGQENAIPSYFRIETEAGLADVALTDKVKLKITDIRDSVRGLKEEGLADNATIEKLLSLYPRITRGEIAILWIISNYEFRADGTPTATIKVDTLKSLDRFLFVTPVRAEESLRDYRRTVEQQRKEAKEKITSQLKIFKELDAIDPVKTYPFVLEEINTQIVMRLPDGDNLLDIFDAIEVSREVPFVVLAYRRHIYYKVYNLIVPHDDWLSFVPSYEGLYFKLLHSPPNRLLARDASINKMYSNGYWSPDNRIDITFIFKGSSKLAQNEGLKLVTTSIGQRIRYEILSTTQVGIKGTFEIGDFDLNRVVMADLISTDSLFKYFLFFNEHSRPAFVKGRFYMYYYPQQSGNIEQSLRLIMTHKPEYHVTEVRISKAQTVQQANITRLILSKLLRRYYDRYDEIFGLYKALISGVEDIAIRQTARSKKEDTKTKQLLHGLKDARPDIFISRYGDLCQHSFQPYALKDEEAAMKLAEELGDPHKILEFDGTWLACEPREGVDKGEPFVYPGLKVNTELHELRDRYPLLPCCFKNDQYLRKKNNRIDLYKRLRKGETVVVTGNEDEKQKGVEYILGSNKLAGPGRYVNMPFYWHKLFDMLGIQKVEGKKGLHYPYLRTGVLESPDSFLHCIELAFNAKDDKGVIYTSLDDAGKRDRVKKVRLALADQYAKQKLNTGKQELYDVNPDVILRDPTAYIDPTMFIDVVRQYYAQKQGPFNIFLYRIDDDTPNSDIVIPRHAQAYLFREINPTIKSIIIFMDKVDGWDFPHQVELVVYKSEKKGARDVAVFENSPLIEALTTLLYDSSDVTVISPEGYEPYRPAKRK